MSQLSIQLLLRLSVAFNVIAVGSAVTTPEPPKKKASLGDLLNAMAPAASNSLERAVATEHDKEFSWYCSLPCLADKNSDPLQWWIQHAETFPNLATLARKYLCIPATSVPSERLFSSARNIVSAKRNSLKPAKVNQLCFLAANA